ncbi:MAG: hypothetical protein Q8O72_14105 [Bacteroidales bacterium]|nr:hypothetical protein [Bacteroidales bacterium]
MKNISRLLVIVFILAIFSSQVRAEKFHSDTKQSANIKQTTAGCSPASAYDWLDINNARARINTGGDMWWDLDNLGKYYIPADGSATSLFAGALWIGGLDINNQLKLAAQRFRQVGIDYWTGPLTIDGTAAIDNTVCAQYDQFFKITRAEVDEFLGHCDPVTGAFIPSEDYIIPQSILNWPAHGDFSAGQSYYLAPFYDVLGDGEYDPFSGDYPYYDISNALCHTKIPTKDEEIEGSIENSTLADQVIKGDQTLWWVFNDKGNIHTETTGSAIGLEIRAQAFAFATNDVINNMTFYSYEIINRSTFELTQTYFSPWVDTDLGFAKDDFVGCDVNRGLGYCYNGKAVDGNGETESYGDQPPAIGVDFFQGPYLDPDGYDNPSYLGDSSVAPTFSGSCEIVTQDGTVRDMVMIRDGVHVPVTTLVRAAAINGVNFGNGIVDDERYGMRRFVFHNNDGSALGDPQIAPEYYNYLRGIWRDNTRMQYGGTGHMPGAGTVGPECDFMFPGDTDPCNWGTAGIPPNGGFNQDGFYWTEETGDNGSPNPPADKRFMQSAGPFTLKSGAVNYITVGIPWARATSGGAFASVELLRVVDDKCQKLFDNCFKVIDGPSAPDLSAVELDRKIIMYIINSPSSNNYRELYQEYDPNIIQPLPQEPGKDPIRSDSIYRFEGYQIFQLSGPTVSVDKLHDPDQARLVAQFDIKNGVSKLVNLYQDDAIGASFPVPVVEVEGGDNGISHSFELTQDAFALGDVKLINNKQYYFMALAYAYNNYLTWAPGPVSYLGQTTPYLSGRKNIKVFTAMPHKTVNGTVINGNYGDSPQITRLAGNGNGGMSIDFTPETVDEIMSKSPAGPNNPFGSPDYPIAYNPVYKINAGPLDVKIVDPLSVVESEYLWWTDTLKPTIIYNVTRKGEVFGDTTHKMVSKWTLMDQSTGELWESDTTILLDYEQLIDERGISINAKQPFIPGPIPVGEVYVDNSYKTSYDVLAANNGLINASIKYADSSRQWLSGVEDFDLPGFALDWIRSGTYKDPDNGSANDWDMSANPDNPWDPNSVYEKMLNGTWAPYSLVSFGNSIGQGGMTESTVGPAFNNHAKSNSKMENLASVDIVFTPDKSKWSRCPVLEAGFYPELAEGEADRFALRASPSVDKDGNLATPGSGPSSEPNDPNYISDHGMGWFPGYAINLETGERLNLMFAEDSYLVAQNGRDMIFNPTKRNLDYSGMAQVLDTSIFRGTNGDAVFGGKHYVYIMDHRSTEFESMARYDMPAYDAGAYSVGVLDTLFNTSFKFIIDRFYALTMYAGVPMGVHGQEWLSNEATIKIRVSKPYQKGYSTLPLDTVYPGMDVNSFNPMYGFSTKGLQTEFDDPKKFQTDLDLITIVPNPYYAYSQYEKNALDNRVKITNLPKECTITIYTVSGLKIKQFTKDSPETTIEWDLKNFASVPIAGGVYYVHAKSAQGERVIKWFSISRIPDLNTF